MQTAADGSVSSQGVQKLSCLPCIIRQVTVVQFYIQLDVINEARKDGVLGTDSGVRPPGCLTLHPPLLQVFKSQ